MYKDLRKIHESNIRCKDGHYVRSKSEKIIDDWQYDNNYLHEYEPIIINKYNPNISYFPDFLLKKENIYIEYWGLDDKKYTEKMNEKAAYYAKNNIVFIGLHENDIMHIDDIMPRVIQDRLWMKKIIEEGVPY